MYDDTDEWGNGQGFTAGLICTLKPGLNALNIIFQTLKHI